MKLGKILPAVLLSFVFFSACEGSRYPPNENIQPTSTPLVNVIPVILPTFTIVPTFTAQPIVPHYTKVTPTFEPWQTETLNPTQIVEATLFPGNNVDIYTFTLISPDGNWLASSSYGGGKFIVTNRDASKNWTIPYQQIYGNSQNYPNNVGGIGIFHWSNDSRYIYFFVFYCCLDFLPDYYSDMYQYSDPLYQLDTQTGLWYQFTPSANVFSFSPTGRRLLYIRRFGGYTTKDVPTIEITILDLQNGKSDSYTLSNHLAAGHIIWSEDGSKAIFSSELGPSLYSDNTIKHSYSIYMIDTKSQTITTVKTFPDSEEAIYPVEWMEGNNILILHKIGNVPPSYEDEAFYLDLNTGKIITPTPSPTP